MWFLCYCYLCDTSVTAVWFLYYCCLCVSSVTAVCVIPLLLLCDSSVTAVWFLCYCCLCDCSVTAVCVILVTAASGASVTAVCVIPLLPLSVWNLRYCCVIPLLLLLVWFLCYCCRCDFSVPAVCDSSVTAVCVILQLLQSVWTGMIILWHYLCSRCNTYVIGVFMNSSCFVCVLRWNWQTSRKSTTVPFWSATFSSCRKGAPPTCRAWWTPWWNCASAATTHTSSMVSPNHITSVSTAAIPVSSYCQYWGQQSVSVTNPHHASEDQQLLCYYMKLQKCSL